MEKKIAFVINPVAGGKKKKDIVRTITDNFSREIPYNCYVWDDKNNFGDIRKELVKENFNVVVAVGGDGTVNEVASTLVETDMALGIIPVGSGNGLARTLGIPMNPVEALKKIETGSLRTIDCAVINGTPFFCTSGVGFDAHIGKLFADSKTRGLMSYVKITLKELFSYSPQFYRMAFNGGSIVREAFLITFANAGQYGNDFYIAPQAKMDDGLLHVVVLKPFSLFNSPFIAAKIMRRKANLSRYIETFTTNEITIYRIDGKGAVHFDGEPAEMGEQLQVKIKPASVKVLV